MLARGIVRIAAVSAASVRARLPRIFSLSDRLLHDRMQILQRRRATERLATHVEVARYRIVAALDRIGEAVQPVGKAEFAPCHVTVLVCVGEFSMHTCVRPKAVPKQLGMQLQ